MNNPPAFQFYPKDFLSDEKVIGMEMVERGVYITLLSMCWIEDGLEIGSRVVQGWFNQYPTVARCFYEKDGKFRNPRLDEERRKQLLWHDKSVKGGKKSAETRRLRKGGSTKGQPKVNQRSTLPSSVFPLPSSNKRDSRESLVAGVVSQWNEFADRHGLAKIEGIEKDSSRERWLLARAKKGLDFPKLLETVAESPFLLGEGQEGKDKPFVVFFDWIIRPTNYQKIIEGNYLNRKKAAAPVETSESYRRAVFGDDK